MNKEKLLEKYPSPITIEGTKEILNQMKNCICKINNDKGKGTGFFCYIEYEDKKFPVMITCNHVIDENIINKDNKINITLNDEKIDKKIIIDNNRKIYTSLEYDITIIEIKPKEDDIDSFLDLDLNIYKKETSNMNNESIYIIQYPQILNEQKACVSYGILKGITNINEISYFCSTCPGSSGSPILKISNNKIIGIHKEAPIYFEFNKGLFLKNPINEYIENNIKKKKKTNIIYEAKENIKNEINIVLKVDKKDINKNIYFLDNNDYKDDKKKISFNKHILELNESNVDIYINDIKHKFQKYFEPIKDGEYNIKLKFKEFIVNCSYMFFCCSNIISIDLSEFYSNDINNMNHMFYWCKNLKKINLTNLNTQNVIDMSNLFQFCENLINLDLSSFNTKKVENMCCMFHNCKNLEVIKFSSSFDTINVRNINQMFFNCNNLTNINLLSFNTQNVKNMSQMFFDCNKLKNLDLSSFEINDDANIEYMFFYCENLDNIKIKKKYENKIKMTDYSKDIKIITV